MLIGEPRLEEHHGRRREQNHSDAPGPQSSPEPPSAQDPFHHQRNHDAGGASPATEDPVRETFASYKPFIQVKESREVMQRAPDGIQDALGSQQLVDRVRERRTDQTGQENNKPYERRQLAVSRKLAQQAVDERRREVHDTLVIIGTVARVSNVQERERDLGL